MDSNDGRALSLPPISSALVAHSSALPLPLRLARISTHVRSSLREARHDSTVTFASSRLWTWSHGWNTDWARSSNRAWKRPATDSGLNTDRREATSSPVCVQSVAHRVQGVGRAVVRDAPAPLPWRSRRRGRPFFMPGRLCDGVRPGRRAAGVGARDDLLLVLWHARPRACSTPRGRRLRERVRSAASCARRPPAWRTPKFGSFSRRFFK